MKKLLSLIFIFISINLIAQKEANIWYFGNHAGLDFNTLPPTVLTDSQMATIEGCSSFSDSNGGLLFYSDGITVYDKNHNIMKYTDGSLADDLKGNPSSSQSGMIIPKPGSNNIYYLFTVGTNSVRNFNLYTINMDLNMGFGQLIDEDGDGSFFKDLSNGERLWSEKVTAVRGKKCNQFWVISVVGTKFYAYEITAAGINLVPIISTVSNPFERKGYLKLSPDGTKLAIADQDNSNAILYSFDNETGKVANDGIILLNDRGVDGEPYGVEFSADSKKVYFSTVLGVRPQRPLMSFPPVTYRLFQFDLTAPDIIASKTIIHQQVAGSQNFPQGGFRGALQLGPDSKIYATIPLAYDDNANGGDASFLDVIENPTADGNNVVFIKNAINLGNSTATQGLPPFITSLFLPIELPIELTDATTNLVINNKTVQYCLTKDIVIQSEPIQIQPGTAISYKWSFTNGGNTSVISNDPNLTINDIKFTDAGDYTLEVTFIDTCSNPTKLKGVFIVEVYNNITIEEPNNLNDPDTNGDGFVTYDFTTRVTPIVLGVQDPIGKEIIYFATEADALANTNPILTPSNYTNKNALINETIWVRIHNQVAPNACYEIRDFKLIISKNPPVVTSSTLTLCDDNADGITTFNLTDANPLISDNSADETFIFFESLADAENNVVDNKIVNPTAYSNKTASNGSVFVRITNESNLSATAQLNLVVNPSPVVTSPVALTLCDDNTDGIAVFNLVDAITMISGNSANETFTFFESLVDAENNMIANKIVNPTTYNNQTATNDHVFVRIENANCFVTAQVNLTVNSLPIVTPVVNIGQCDDNADLITIVNLTLRQSAISANYATETFQYFATEANAIAGAPQIANPIQYPVNANGQVWVRTISSKGCYVISKINISIAFADNVLYNRIFTECDDFLDADGNDTAANNDSDGITTFDFSEARNDIYNDPVIVGVPNLEIRFYENQLDRAAEINEIPDISNHRNNKYLAYANEQTIYVKIINTINRNCRGIAKLTLRVNPVPNFEVTSPQAICLNNATDHITLMAETPKAAYTYQWVDANGVNLGTTISQEINTSGEYTVTATATDGTMCTKSRTIVVNKSNIATITNDDVTINDSNTNSITINTANLGIGDYEFALLNESGIVRKYQNEPIFQDVEGGLYTIAVRDKNGCGVATLPIAVIQFPKFFTPNGDGINDTWTVKGGVANFFPENNVSIFNRQGKLISQFNFNTKGWNGFYKGNQLPSTDYWFKVRAVDKQGNIYNKKGHFSLLRK